MSKVFYTTEYEKKILNIMLKWDTRYKMISFYNGTIYVVIDSSNDPHPYALNTIHFAYEWYFRLKLLLGIRDVKMTVGLHDDEGCHHVMCPIQEGIKFNEKGEVAL